jgi:hypothetical protein
MKTLKKLALVSMLALSSPAWSIPLATVGGIDDLIGQTTLANSGAANEISWIESVLGYGIDDAAYTQTQVTAADWVGVDNNPGTFAIGLDGPADWFLVKIGNNSGSSFSHFLFDNLTSLNWAVIDLVEMGFNENNSVNIGKISHLGTAPPSTSVPEPGVLALMGLGLLGFGLTRRRKAQ